MPKKRDIFNLHSNRRQTKGLRMSDSDSKRAYLDVLLKQYQETLEFIRNDSNAVWQIPILLLTAMSVLGLAYTQLQGNTILIKVNGTSIQLSNQLSNTNLQIGRILVLLLALGFSLVSLVALVKHRVSCNLKTTYFENIESQLIKLLNQDGSQSWFSEINSLEDNKFEFRKIKLKAEDIADTEELEQAVKLKNDKYAIYRRWFYRRSAYRWQLFLTVLVIFGVAGLLAYEFLIANLGILISFEVIALVGFLVSVRREESKRKKE